MKHPILSLAAASIALALVGQQAFAQSEAACIDTARKSVDAARKDLTPLLPPNPVKAAPLKSKLVWFISPTQATAYALEVSKQCASLPTVASRSASARPTMTNWSPCATKSPSCATARSPTG